MTIASDTHKRPFILAVIPFVLIAMFAWAGYFNSLNVPFTFDDERNIIKNQSVLMTDLSPSSMKEAAFGSGNPTPRPVAYLSFGLNHRFGELNVFGYHMVNIFIHMFNGWLVFVLARHLCPILVRRTKDNPKSTQTLFALAVALIFISHPVQTQSVTYIVQRMASLCTLFYLAGLLSYIKGRSISSHELKSRYLWWSFAFVLWVLALGTKQFAVTLPIAIMLYEWIVRGGVLKPQRRTVAVVSAGGGIMLLVAVVFKSGMFFSGGTFSQLFVGGYQYRDFTLTERLMTEARVVMHYISLLVWPPPSRLTLVYDYPISASLLSPRTTILSILGLTTMTVASVLLARRAPLVAFGVLWFMIHLAVESTIIPLEIAYEHRLYMPIIGAGLLFVGGAFVLIKNHKAAFTLVLIVSSVMLVGTHLRNQTWQDQLGMWEDNAKKQPSEPRAYFNMAVILSDAGKNSEAIDMLEQTIRLEPRHQAAMIMAGDLLRQEKRYQDAVDALSAAIAFEPEEHLRYTRLHWFAYMQRASLLEAAGRFDLAAQDYTGALELPPLRKENKTKRIDHDTEAHAMRGLAYLNLHRYHEAIADFEAALSLNPDHVLSNNNLAWILSTNPDPAIRDGKRAAELSAHACELTEWKQLSTLSTYAVTMAETGDFAAAIEWQIKCIRLAPPSTVGQYQARLDLFRNNTPIRSE